MVFTKEQAEQLVKDEMVWAKKQRARLGFNNQNGFEPRLTVFGPGGQIAIPPVRWGNRDQMLRYMAAIAVSARTLEAVAVMLASDSTSMDVAKVAKFMGWPVPDHKVEGSLEAFNERYGKLFNDPLLNRDMRNLPEELWQNSVMVMIKGPGFPCVGLTARYVGGGGNTVVYNQTGDSKPIVHRFNMLEDWWTMSEDHPAVVAAEKQVKNFMNAHRN